MENICLECKHNFNVAYLPLPAGRRIDVQSDIAHKKAEQHVRDTHHAVVGHNLAGWVK